MTVANLSFDVAELAKFDINVIPAIVSGDLLAARFPNFCPEETRAYALNQLKGNAGVGYAVEKNFRQVVGRAKFDFEDIERYLDEAPAWFEEVRGVFGPYRSPVEKLWLELQRWPEGCRLQRFNSRFGFTGLIRAFEVGGGAGAHEDNPDWDHPNVPEDLSFGLLSAVNYLEAATSGGLLEAWDFGFTDQKKYEENKVANHYSIDRKKIGLPKIVLSPRAGETIIFNPRRLHAVTPVVSGKRSTQSTFIAYRGLNSYLSLFC